MFRSRSANVVSISASLTLSSSVCFFSGRSSCNLSTFAWLRSSFFLMDWTLEGIFSTSWLNSSMSSSTWDFSSKWRLQVGQLGFTSYTWLANHAFIFCTFRNILQKGRLKERLKYVFSYQAINKKNNSSASDHTWVWQHCSLSWQWGDQFALCRWICWLLWTEVHFEFSPPHSLPVQAHPRNRHPRKP